MIDQEIVWENLFRPMKVINHAILETWIIVMDRNRSFQVDWSYDCTKKHGTWYVRENMQEVLDHSLRKAILDKVKLGKKRRRIYHEQ